MYETVDNFAPVIWEGDGAHPSPNYTTRYSDYGVAALPSSAFNGDTFDIGGGGAVLSRYQAIYNDLIDLPSPMEIDVAMNVLENNQLEINADVLVTEDIPTRTEYRFIYTLTYHYTDSYNSTVVRYYEEDYTLFTNGDMGTFTHTFDLDPSWDLANLRTVVMVQDVNTTGTFTVGGYTFNMYPMLQGGIAGYPLSVVTPIEDQIIMYNETIDFDVMNFFQYQGTPVDLDLQVVSSDEAIATASITDNTLTVTAQETTGETIITVSGEHEGYGAAYSFPVNVISPDVIPVFFNLYDSYGDGWQYSGSQNYIQLYDYYITLESGGEGQVTVFLEPGTHDYTYTAADNWGSENSWTINLEDGTEIGSGEGGANGTYDFSFVLEPIVDAEDDVPELTYSLGNYPNPFNPVTNINFTNLENEHVKIEIFNARGQKVNVLVDEKMLPGNHSVIWDGTDDRGDNVASGIYLYKMKAGGRYTSTKKMILLK
jgi:hypothetical protein